MSALNEVLTIAEATKLLGKGNSYLYDMIKYNRLIEGCHYRVAGGGKLILRDVVIRIKSGESIDFIGKKWGELKDYEKEFLLSQNNCIDAVNCEVTESGECIVDLTENLSVPGKFVDGELVIDDEAVIYCPIA